MTEGSSISTSLRRVRSEVRDLLVTTSSLPRLTQEVLEGVGNADWIRRDLDNVAQAIVRVERMVRALLFSLLGAAFLVAAAFLASRYTVLAMLALAVAVLFIARVAVFMLTVRRPPW